MNPRMLALLVACLSLSGAYASAAEPALIPKPKRIETGRGAFVLDGNVRVIAPGDARSREIAAFAREAIGRDSGIELADGNPRKARAIELRLDPSVKGEEAYRLKVTPSRITLEASHHRGLFWAVQTLRQLLPVPSRDVSISIPAMRIADAPRFAYRGHMLDVGRHFMPVDFIKKQIDLLSYYKLNTFRWHLTEDQGWRIEIRKYPKLTEVGAWRTEADGSRYGGYYTQAQIRELVEYARLRNIMVIPEIEMPGHASAALAAYPELSCRKQPIDVPTSWGVFKDVYCVGDEFTFEFIEDVIDEVVELFPAPYLHIGGDEVPKERWRESASSQRRMRDEGLKDEHELQSYFVRRIQRYLAGKGKTLIGWDEILEGGADRDAIVEVWRGEAEGAKALANGNRVIYAAPFYLDWALDSLTLEEVYRTEVLAPTFVSRGDQVLGAEAPLWTERITPRNAESMLYPRLLAFAETTWSAADARDYADFRARLQTHYQRLDAWRVGYGPEDRNVVDYTINRMPEENAWRLQAARGFDDLQLHYTRDGSEPEMASPSFTDALSVREPATLNVVPFRNGRPYAQARSFVMSSHRALGKPVEWSSPPNRNYRQAGDAVLVDGLFGGDSHADGLWTGWQGEDLRATIDLQQATPVRSVAMRFLQQNTSWILLPQAVRYYASRDGQRWQLLQSTPMQVDPQDEQRSVREVRYNATKAIDARYIRVEVDQFGPLPQGHNGAGNPAFFFTDEIVVQ
ncbi:MAG TPA: family 20 glycosylhydrolase [Lysobacter sp.]